MLSPARAPAAPTPTPEASQTPLSYRERRPSAVASFMKRHALLVYFVLTLLISWGALLPVLGPASSSGSTQLDSAFLFAIVVGPMGPGIAGIVLTVVVSGRRGLGKLFSGLTVWRVEARWYAVALLTAPVLCTTVLLALSLVSPEFLPRMLAGEDPVSLLLPGLAAGLMAGVFEELGWTGFAIPRLRLRYSILTTGLFVGSIWGAWHFPLFWQPASFSSTLLMTLLVVQLFSWLPAYRTLMVWVYDRARSLLVVVLMHAALVATQMVIVPASLQPGASLMYVLAWAAALWVAVVALGMRSGGSLASQACQQPRSV